MSSTMTTRAPSEKQTNLVGSTGGPPGHYMLDREDVWQRSVRDSGRTTSINCFLILIVSGLVYLTVYGVLFWLYRRWIVEFGMEWVWALIFVSSSLDVLGGLAGIAGVATGSRGFGDAMSLAAALLMSVGLVLGVFVFFGVPSEDSRGEDWHTEYPQRCYQRLNVGRSRSAACTTIRVLGICLWCTFVSFLLRMLVVCVSQWSVWRAKHGDPPPKRYVILNEPVIPTSYFPNYYVNKPYILQTDGGSTRELVV